MCFRKWSLLLLLIGSTAALAKSPATFTEPRNGDTVANRESFVAAVAIDDFSTAGKYWVALASVTGHETSWERVLELREKAMRADDSAARSEMLALIDKWPLDLFWPKFFVPKSPYGALVFDGGTNPLSGLEPQPMVLLLIQVDDSLQDFIRKWFKNKDFPGISATRLRPGMILARSEVFFP